VRMISVAKSIRESDEESWLSKSNLTHRSHETLGVYQVPKGPAFFLPSLSPSLFQLHKDTLKVVADMRRSGHELISNATCLVSARNR
jgi:ABC-type transporter lipoprotein component MlaA